LYKSATALSQGVSIQQSLTNCKGYISEKCHSWQHFSRLNKGRTDERGLQKLQPLLARTE